MAYQPNPNDPYRAGLSEEEIRHQARLNSLDNELQADPTLAEGCLLYTSDAADE